MIPLSWASDLMATTQMQALGWALLQFLWQGTVVALLTAGVLLMVRQNAKARYAVGVIGLFTMLATFCVTLVVTLQTWQPTQQNTTELLLGSGALQGVQSWGRAWFVANLGRWMTAETVQLGLSWMTVLWVSGVLWFQLRFVLQWNHVSTMRRAAQLAPPSHLQPIVTELQQRLGLRKAIRVLESATLKVPAVVGWLDPIVLVPVGILAHLSQDQLRAVLAHELAHLRRNDHLVNLLQSLTESLLFFHPAVWWLSNQVRIEREFCCDDLAVDVCGDTLSYARALQTLEDIRAGEIELSRSRFGMNQVALASTGGSLMDRITRLFGVQPSSKRTQSRWGVPAVLAILLGMALFAASCEPTLVEEPQVQSESLTQDNTSWNSKTELHREKVATKLERARNHFRERLDNGEITQEQYETHMEKLDRVHDQWQEGKFVVERKRGDDGHMVFFSEDGTVDLDGKTVTKAQLKEMLHEHHGELLEIHPEATEDLHGNFKGFLIEDADASGDNTWISEDGSMSLKEIREIHPDAQAFFLPEGDLHTEPVKDSIK